MNSVLYKKQIMKPLWRWVICVSLSLFIFTSHAHPTFVSLSKPSTEIRFKMDTDSVFDFSKASETTVKLNADTYISQQIRPRLYQQKSWYRTLLKVALRNRQAFQLMDLAFISRLHSDSIGEPFVLRLEIRD